MEETKLYGTPEETAEKEAIMQVDFSKATGEDMARLLTSWATEDEEEIEDALHNLPRKDGKVNGPDSV